MTGSSLGPVLLAGARPRNFLIPNISRTLLGCWRMDSLETASLMDRPVWAHAAVC